MLSPEEITSEKALWVVVGFAAAIVATQAYFEEPSTREAIKEQTVEASIASTCQASSLGTIACTPPKVQP